MTCKKVHIGIVVMWYTPKQYCISQDTFILHIGKSECSMYVLPVILKNVTKTNIRRDYINY